MQQSLSIEASAPAEDDMLLPLVVCFGGALALTRSRRHGDRRGPVPSLCSSLRLQNGFA